MNVIQSFIHSCLMNLVWFILRCFMATYRIERRGGEKVKIALELNPRGSYIFACWHEQMISFLTCHAWTEPFLAMASRSKDGDFAAFIAKKMGFVPVRGSSRKKNVDKGGKEAMLEYVEKLNNGHRGGLTVDGPRGPRHVVKPGIALISQQSGAPIIPAVGLASSYWEFSKAWDKFKIPKPFSKLILIYGEPILVPKEASPEKIQEVCRIVEERIKELENSYIVELKQ